MARFTQTSHATASKRSVLVAAWMFAAAIAAVFNTENFVGFRQAQTNPRGITVHATSGDGVVAIPIGDARPRKLKTRDELVYDTLGGIAAGGATAMMLIASAATTISMLKQATPAVPAAAGQSVAVSVTTPAVVSTTLPAQIVAAPASKVVALPAVQVVASRMPKVAAAPASKVAAPVAARVASAVTRSVVPRTAARTVAKSPVVVPRPVARRLSPHQSLQHRSQHPLSHKQLLS